MNDSHIEESLFVFLDAQLVPRFATHFNLVHGIIADRDIKNEIAEFYTYKKTTYQYKVINENYGLDDNAEIAKALIKGEDIYLELGKLPIPPHLSGFVKAFRDSNEFHPGLVREFELEKDRPDPSAHLLLIVRKNKLKEMGKKFLNYVDTRCRLDREEHHD